MSTQLPEPTLWIKLVAIQTDNQNIALHIHSDGHFLFDSQLRIFKNQDNIIFIKNLSAPHLHIDDSLLPINQEKQLFGGEKLYLNHQQDLEDLKFDYVFCFVNNSQANLKRDRDEARESKSHSKLVKIETDLQKELICPICTTNYLEKCMVLSPCLHSFCNFRLFSHLKLSNNCPLCTVEAVSVAKNFLLSNVAQLVGENFPIQQRPQKGKELEQISFGGTIIRSEMGVYIGSYQNGKKNGKGKFIYKDGRIYEGSWKDDQRQGKGVMICNHGEKYDGYWMNNRIHGFGKYIWSNRQEYEGNWQDHVFHGYGIIKYSSGRIYKGNWKNGKEEGKGLVIFDNGDQYDGTWINGCRTGAGKFIWSNGQEYKGNFQENSKHGYGIMSYRDGKVYKGDWKKGQREGKGVLIYANGDKYDGFWRSDSFNGRGKLTWSGGQEYAGDFKDDFRHGSGTMRYEGGKVYKGDWKRGKREGKGIFTLVNGNVCEGEWVNDALQPEVKIAYSTGEKYQGEIEVESFKKFEKEVKVDSFKRHGQGIQTLQNGEKYLGKWVNDILVNKVSIKPRMI